MQQSHGLFAIAKLPVLGFLQLYKKVVNSLLLLLFNLLKITVAIEHKTIFVFGLS